MSARRTKGAACATGAGRYRPYPAYKDSGVEWLGEIPAHWEVKRLKHLANMQAGSAITSETIEPTGDYPVFGGNGIRGFTDSFTHEGDFPLIGRQGALCGCVNLASGKFWASEHAVVARPARDVDAFWLAALLESMTLNSYSQSAAQPGIAVDTIGALSAPAPPLPEQRAIAAFLDRETARIDALVAKKERLIALLQEQRTALITRAVTKGLDPTVPMKDSGVEWLGEIPAHWEGARMWRISNATSGGTPAKEERGYWDGDIPWVSPKDMKRRFIDSSEDTITERAVRETGIKLIAPPVVLIVVRGMILAHTFPVAITTVPVTINQDMKALRFRQRIEPIFATWLFEGVGRGILGAVVEEAAHGTRVIRMDRWRAVVAPVPPIGEQRATAAFLDRETARIDALVAKVRDASERLKELRTALISAAVTGKIDVRPSAEASAQAGEEVA